MQQAPISKYYASSTDIHEIKTSGQSRAEWIFNLEDADKDYFAIIHEMEWIIPQLKKMLSMRASICYAVVSSTVPFQVTHIDGENYFLLIERNAFYNLLTLSFRIHTLPKFSEHLGSSQIPIESSCEGLFLLDIIKKFLANPINPQEAFAATKSSVVYQSAFLFIMAHEIAHISHGHLIFQGSEDFKQFALDEEDKNLTFRTLEMDADSSATTNVFAMMEHLIGVGLDQWAKTMDVDKLAAISFLRAQYITGIYTALIFSDACAKSFLPVKHPISYARFLTSLRLLTVVLYKDIGEEESKMPETLRQSLVDAFIELSGGIEHLGHPMASNMMELPPNNSEPIYHYDALGEAIGLAQLEPLYSRWSRIRPLLEKYQLGGTLAPATAAPY
ncbi:hypothetical protein [Methylotenera versatilis]|uniref:Uncharacterized protein n=1 Tax=Methylotenera versatilis (strain 301) TaxID=666681 RepID=D7DL97_METV0|nr:hypothetical protein [Methylotenera versatilis]ADI30568.1 hypothetical protein M301_2201 [Methylotenera versatilis 301]